MRMWPRRKGCSGFSVIEIMSVAGVLALLMALGFMLHRSMSLAASVSVAESDLKQIATGMELYFRQYGTYPPQGSNLAEVLAPFIDNPQVFNNPLKDEPTPGKTISDLYTQPDTKTLDSPNNYLTAMISDDGTTAVILKTGDIVDRHDDLRFDPNSPPSDILAILNPDTQPDDQGSVTPPPPPPPEPPSNPPVVASPNDYTEEQPAGVVHTKDCFDAEFKVVSSNLTWGGVHVPITVSTTISDADAQAGSAKMQGYGPVALFGNTGVSGGETEHRIVRKSDVFSLSAHAEYGSWAATYASDENPSQVECLRNGDLPSEFDPNQPGHITPGPALAGLIDPASGMVTIADNQVLFLFELGATSRQGNPSFDLQDLVVLATLKPPANPAECEDVPVPMPVLTIAANPATAQSTSFPVVITDTPSNPWDVASNVQLAAQVTGGNQYVSQVSVSPATIASIANGASATATVTVTTTSSWPTAYGEQIQVAVRIAGEANNPAANNGSSVTVTIAGPETPEPTPVLTIAANPATSTSTTFPVVVTNIPSNPRDVASNVQLAAQVAGGSQYVSQVTITPATIASIANGASSTANVTVTPTTAWSTAYGQQVQIVARIVSEANNPAANNGSSVTVTITGPTAPPEPVLTAKSDGTVTTAMCSDVLIKVLGSQFGYADGTLVDVGASAKIGSAAWFALNSGKAVHGGETYSSTSVPAGTQILVKSGILDSSVLYTWSRYGWASTFTSTDGSGNVITLKNGDKPICQNPAYSYQASVKSLLAPYVDPQTGLIKLPSNQVIYAFDFNSLAEGTGIDFNDLVILATATAAAKECDSTTPPQPAPVLAFSPASVTTTSRQQTFTIQNTATGSSNAAAGVVVTATVTSGSQYVSSLTFSGSLGAIAAGASSYATVKANTNSSWTYAHTGTQIKITLTITQETNNPSVNVGKTAQFIITR